VETRELARMITELKLRELQIFTELANMKVPVCCFLLVSRTFSDEFGKEKGNFQR